MPIQPTYPGVYIQELPSGTHTIAGVATSITGFVGYLRRGPLNTPVQCLNFGDFQRVFGGLDALSETSFQVSQFFLNGGSEAWVSRLYAASAPPVQPAAPLNGGPLGGTGTPGSSPAAPTGGPLLNVAALSPGTWGQNVYVTIDYMSAAVGTFDFTATYYNVTSSGMSVAQVQALPGVTMDASKPNYIVQALNAAGNPNAGLVAITDPANPVPGPGYVPPSVLPFASGTLLSFKTPPATIPNVSITLTLQAPTPPGSKPVAPPPLPAIQVGSITTLSDALGAIQTALAVAGPQNGFSFLTGATVRSSNAPFPVAAGTLPMTLIQVVAGDPSYAGWLIGIAATPPTCGLATVQTNVQATPLVVAQPAAKAPPITSPDGLPPTGFDVAGNATARTGIYALDNMSLVNILCVPDMRLMTQGDYLISGSAMLNYALRRRAFAIVDVPAAVTSPSAAVAWMTSVPAGFGAGIISAAAYFPQPLVPTPFQSLPIQIGANGTMAGLYAATDAARGVWKAPAGITAALGGVQQLSYVMTDQENGLINPLGLNALRTFPIYDSIAWGARTLAAGNVADDDWKYVPVRRLTLYIEQSLIQGLQWAVFEPNDETLWQQIRLAVNGFLHPLFVQGAFVGPSQALAYLVTCDASTTTADDMDNGVVNVLVQFAPVRPAEFVTISIQQMAGQSAS